MTGPDSPAADGGDAAVTVLLRAWATGDKAALDALIPVVQAELKRLAASYMRRERVGHTLDATALVNEAYLRLVDQRDVNWTSRGHFFAVAAQAMRRVLVDHARGHVAAKRGGGAERVTLSNISPVQPAQTQVDVLWLNEALEQLATLDARQAKIVEFRYFAGMSVEEVAVAMDLSPATIKREWSTARVWLAHRLRSGRSC
jgi:RNA polymerase sigma-70 factor, ECF subfamily